MRAHAAAVVLVLAGCNQVFGLEAGHGDDDGTLDADDGDGGTGDGGDAGPDADESRLCNETDVVFCARFENGLTDDGFHAPITTTGGSIGWISEAPRYARSIVADSSLPEQATIDATLSVGGPATYVITFLVRGSLGCGAGGEGDTIPVDVFRLLFPTSGISAFIRHRGSGVDVGIDSPGGPLFGSVDADLSGDFHRLALTVDFPANQLQLRVDDLIETNTAFDAEPLGGAVASIIVGARAGGQQRDCQLEYDDIVVHVRQP